MIMSKIISINIWSSVNKKAVNAFLIQNTTLQHVLTSCQQRNLHKQALSRNITIISPTHLSEKTNFKVLDAGTSEKPLVLIYDWMLAKERHVLKFAKFYTDHGANVLRIRVSPFDMLRPRTGTHVVADRVLEFLNTNAKFNPILVHGFSVGAYVFCELMVKISKNMEEHSHILDRFVGQIWDSPVDVEGVPSGLSKAVTKNKIIQASCEKYLNWYLKFNYEKATVHYNASSQKMHENFLNVPGLFIFSKGDVVSTPQMVMKVVKKWEDRKHQVFTRCFESSAHVSHYHRYKEDYERELMAFLQRISFLYMDKGRCAMV